MRPPNTQVEPRRTRRRSAAKLNAGLASPREGRPAEIVPPGRGGSLMGRRCYNPAVFRGWNRALRGAWSMDGSTTPLDEARRSLQASHESTLIYLHIGKTAGVTLHQVLRRQFPPSQTFWLHRSPVRGQATDATAGAERDEQEAIPSEGRPNRELSLAYVASLPREKLARLRLIEGHT